MLGKSRFKWQASSSRTAFAVIAGMAALFAASEAFAAGSHSGGHMMEVGKPGKASAASSTIDIVMYDNYFEPEAISVKAGETIRFKIRNAGEFVHEFNIGTAAMHAEHRKEMTMMVEHGVLQADHIDMQAAKAMQASMGHGMHNDPNSVLLEPGKSGEIVWTFPKNAEVALEFGCNVPGHYDSGMMGQFRMER